MKVKVKAFMAIKKLMGNNSEVELEIKGESINNLIEELSLRYGEELRNEIFNDENKKVKPYYHILVNGRSYLELSDHLDTKMKEGDVVALFPPVGGG